MTTRKYPCGCLATGTEDIPPYCPQHGAPLSSNQRLEFLRQALSLAREAMMDCQHNAHKGKVCFDGDHWHETLETVDAALKRITDETEVKHE